MKRPPIVIVGASLAGGTAAVTLREEGFDGDIVLIGAESQLPYNRPPLSKGYLRGQDRFDDQLVKPASYYAEQRIQLKLGVRATAIDPKQKLVELEGGERLVYDRLLVTTGGRNRTLTVPGANLAGVFQLRTVQDCDRIRAAVAPGRRAAVIGFSFIGSEVSASLRQLGVEVVAIEGARVPLARVLGDEVGQVLAASTARRASSSSPRIPSTRSKARAVWSGSAPARTESSSATWSSPGSVSCPTPSFSRRPARRSTTVCSWTSIAVRRCRTCSRPAT